MIGKGERVRLKIAHSYEGTVLEVGTNPEAGDVAHVQWDKDGTDWWYVVDELEGIE